MAAIRSQSPLVGMAASAASFTTTASSFDVGLSKLVIGQSVTARMHSGSFASTGIPTRMNSGSFSSTGSLAAYVSPPRSSIADLPMASVVNVSSFGGTSFLAVPLPPPPPAAWSFASSAVSPRRAPMTAPMQARSRSCARPNDNSFTVATAQDPGTPPQAPQVKARLPPRFLIAPGKENQSTVDRVSEHAKGLQQGTYSARTVVLGDRSNTRPSAMASFSSQRSPQASFRQASPQPIASHVPIATYSEPQASFRQRSPAWRPVGSFVAPVQQRGATASRSRPAGLIPPRGLSVPPQASFSTMPPAGGPRPHMARVASWNTFLPPAPEGVDERLWVMCNVCPPGNPNREISSDGKVEGDQEDRINYWRAKGGDMLRSLGVAQESVMGAGLL